MEAGALAAGAALRAALALHPAWPHSLATRNELATPLSALQRLQEGHHLASHLATPLNPYEAGAVHHPPLALALLGPLTDPHSSQPALSWAAWIAADVLTAWALARVADRRKRRPLVVDDGEKQWTGARVAALYLFHPFAIATILARSTTSFSNLFLALALSSAVEGSLITSAFHLSLAAHLSLYPVLLLPPLILVAHITTNSLASAERAPRSRVSCAVEGVLAFAGHQAVLLALSRWLTGSWAFLSSVYGVILTTSDLTPNIGLAWYFFIEMFDHFRAFFLVVFALHPLAYVAPLTIHYRKDPLFAAVLLIGAISLLKSYPSLGDWSLWHALLGCYSELLPHVTSPLFHSLLPLYALLLLPSFSHLWLGSNSGNANFFYASTLVWAVAMGGWAVEAGKAWGRREAMRGLGEEARAKVRSGEWKVVQR